MRALVFKKSIPRYLWTKLVSTWSPGLSTIPGTSLGLYRVPEPGLPTPSWARVKSLLSGICGSDLAVIQCKGSLYLTAFTSFPFTPGHEIYGEVMEVGDDVKGFVPGDRVVIEPALGCAVRGFSDPCAPCAEGRHANCLRVTQGEVSKGLQTGYCRSVPGGWGAQLVAHQSQLYRVPDGLSPEAAVLVEPFSCAVHGVMGAKLEKSAKALVVGCGSMGLLTIASLRALAPECQIVAMAKYPHQRRLASELGADQVVPSGVKGYRELADIAGARLHSIDIGKPAVIGGFPWVFECVGASSALDDATRWAAESGLVVMQGMPSDTGADLVSVWYKQVRLVGSYAYGLERHEGRRVRTFDLSLRLLSQDGLGGKLAGLVTHRFPITRYREAITTALKAGARGGVKTVFDLTKEA